MSQGHHPTRRYRRLERAGFRFETTPAGKRRWGAPETGELISEDRAVTMAKDSEERALEGAGWERTNIEGETYWRRPDSGRLYPQEAAYDVLKDGSEEATN